MANETQTSGKSQSDKYSKAVADATGTTTIAKMSPEEAAIAVASGAAGMKKKADPARLLKMVESGKYEFAPQNIAMEEGETIEGILEGEGPGNDFENDDGEIKHVKSWIIAALDGSNMRASMLSTAQLDRKLPPFIGGPVYIQRGKDIKTSGGRKCTEYLVGGLKLPNNQIRSFALPVAVEQPALPAGNVIDAASTTSPNGVSQQAQA